MNATSSTISDGGSINYNADASERPHNPIIRTNRKIFHYRSVGALQNSLFTFGLCRYRTRYFCLARSEGNFGVGCFHRKWKAISESRVSKQCHRENNLCLMQGINLRQHSLKPQEKRSPFKTFLQAQARSTTLLRTKAPQVDVLSPSIKRFCS